MLHLNMPEPFTRLATTMTGLLLDTAIKATLLLGVLFLLAWLFRRASAATRHLLWAAGILGLLLLPLASLGLPAWRILPNWLSPSLPIAGAPVVPASPASSELPVTPEATQRLAREAGTPWLPNLAASTAEPIAPAASPVSNSAVDSSATPLALTATVGFLWLAGTLMVLAPLLLTPLFLGRLRRNALLLQTGTWPKLLKELRTNLGLRRRVVLLQSPNRPVPLTFGFLRPTILLPTDAGSWTRDRRRVVLLHELAHIKRWDCLIHLLARVACAMYWFHPLAWLATRRLSVERERACDDLVLNAGTRCSDYASELLSIATNLHPHRVMGYAALAMARPSTLERRLNAILDPGCDRRGITRIAMVFCTAAVTVTVLTLAVCHAQTAPAAPTSEYVAKWASQHGFDAQDIEPTTLELPGNVPGRAWRNLPFALTKDEEADARTCIKIAKRTHNTFNGKTEFSKPATRADLEDLLKKRPDYFYAEWLLASWHRDHGDPKEATRLLDAAYQHAPVIIVQRYQFADGSPLANTSISSFALECNRVVNFSLDPSLELLYLSLRTDAQGCIFLPVYNTVYRTNLLASPVGHTVTFPRLGWFQTTRKVAFLPPATVIANPAGTASRPAASSPGTQGKTVTYHWQTSQPIDSQQWVINNKKPGEGGSQAVPSDQLTLVIQQSDSSIDYRYRIGEVSGETTGKLDRTTAGRIRLTIPPEGRLTVTGPTSILRIEEWNDRDPNPVNIRELFVGKELSHDFVPATAPATRPSELPIAIHSRDLSGTWTGERDGIAAKIEFFGDDDARWQIKTSNATISAKLKRVDDPKTGTVGLRLDYFITASGKKGSSIIGTLSKDASGKLVLAVLPSARELENAYPPATQIPLQNSPAPNPATQPATQPAGFELAHGADMSIGLSFDRPSRWRTDGGKVINPKSGQTDLVFAMDGYDAGTQPTLKFSAENVGAEARIDVTTPANPSATASKIFSIDGQPARLTAYKIANTGTELLVVQTAKGTRTYTVTMVFPSSQRDKYLALADIVCASIRITPPAAQIPLQKSAAATQAGPTGIVVDALLEMPSVEEDPNGRMNNERWRLMSKLAALGDSAIPAIKEGNLKSTTALQRQELSRALANVKTRAGTEALQELFKDKDDIIRGTAIMGYVERIGKPEAEGGGETILPTLARVIREEPVVTHRMWICRGMERVLPAKEGAVRQEKMEEAALRVLRERLSKDESEAVRCAAACSLTVFGDMSGVEELKKGAIRMADAREENGMFLEQLAPAIERVSGRSFGKMPLNPMCLSNLGKLPEVKMQRRALAEALAAWAEEKEK